MKSKPASFINWTSRSMAPLVSFCVHSPVSLSACRRYPITWLALAGIGAVMVPIVLSSTPREIEYFIRDSGARFIVVEGAELKARAIQPGSAPLPPPERVIFVWTVDEDVASPWLANRYASGRNASW